MVAKNNCVDKMEKTAERKPHFAIRKLTIGAASVLLGTSLWLGVNGNVSHAADVNSDSNVAHEQEQSGQAAAQPITKATQVVVKGDAQAENAAPADDQAEQSQLDQAQDGDAGAAAIEQEEIQAVGQAGRKTGEQEPAAQKKAPTDPKQEPAPAKVKAPAASKPQADTDTKPIDQEKHQVTISNIDDTTGKTLYGTGTFQDKTGEQQDVRYSYVGYKLMNPEALDGIEIHNPAYGRGTFTVPDHDVNLTLHFAQLAPITVEYVDTDGKLLTKFSSSAAASTSESPYSAQDGINTSVFTANAVDIPGYELVSAPSLKTKFDQVSTKDDLNAKILKFVYKQIAPNADQGLPNGGGAGISGVGTDYGIKWDNLLGGAQVDMVYPTYGDSHYEESVAKMKEQYTKQGFSFLGVTNDHKDSDPVNRLESKGTVHFLKHQPVTVNYVDEDGHKLADSVVLSFNKNNPDQTNNGINPAKYWNPEGAWHSEQKDFAGYALKKVEGATSGKFTTFGYNVTYVYAKKTQTPDPGQPTKPTQPTKLDDHKTPDPTPVPPSPVEPTQPVQPSSPTEPTSPAEPETVTPHAAETPVEPETPTDEPAPAPHANETPKEIPNVTKHIKTPHAAGGGVTITKNGNVINKQGHQIGQIDRQGVVHQTLPQTGDQAEVADATAILGSLVAGLSLIGLAGVRKEH